MRLRRLCLAVLLVLAATGSSQAGWFDLAFNDNSFDVSGGFHFGKSDDSKLALGGRYLFDDDRDTHLGAFVIGFAMVPPDKEGIDVNFGAQVLFGSSGDEDIGGIAIGADGNWQPANMKGFFFGGKLYYGPSVFAWSDSDGFLEWGGRAGYRITPKFAVYLQYQKVEGDFEIQSNRKLNDELLIAFRGEF